MPSQRNGCEPRFHNTSIIQIEEERTIQEIIQRLKNSRRDIDAQGLQGSKRPK